MTQSASTARDNDAHKRGLDLLDDAFQALDEGMVLCDSELCLVKYNDNYVDMMHPEGSVPRIGASARIQAQAFADSERFVIPEGMTATEWAESVIEGIVGCAKNVVIRRTDGVLFLASSHRTRTGGYLLSIKDVTEKHRAEEARRESDDLLKTIVNACPANFMVSRVADGKIIYRSIASTARFGEIESARSFFLKPQDRQSYLDALLPTGVVDDYPVRFRKGDGSIMDGLTSARVTKYKGEDVIVSSTRDVTELKRAHKAEREAAELLSKVVDACPANLLMSRVGDGSVLYRSPASARLFGEKPSARGHWNDIADRVKYLKRLEEIGSVDDMFVYGLKADGTAFPSQVSARTVEHQGETVVVSSTTDLTEAFAQQEQLEQANTRFVEAIDALDEGLILLDSDLKFVMENKRARTLFSTEAAPARVGEPASGLITRYFDQDQSKPGNGLDPAVGQWISGITGHAQSREFDLPDGRIIVCSSHKTSLEGYLLTFKDVSSQRLTEASKLDAVFDAIQALDEGLVLYDADMNFVMGNAKLDQIFYSGEIPQPRPGDNAYDTMNDLLQSGFYAIPANVSSDEFMKQMMDSLRNYAKSVTVTSSAGRVFNTSVHKTALGGYLVSFSDITDQRQAEQELARQQQMAHQNEKLSALGELLAGVAHELNNPLSIVVGYAQMIQGRVDDPVLNRRIERIGQAADRSAKIVKTFLAMARQRPTRLMACSLNDTIDSAFDLAGYGLRSAGAEIIWALDADLPVVSADSDQIVQVFTNLIVNAEHALAEKGDQASVQFRTWYDTATNDVVAEVRDNGAGVPKEFQSRIFEPFFTTKDIDHGTGVGLAFSHRVVDGHGGQLSVQSIPGQGACFSVRLPAVEFVSGEDQGPAEIAAKVDSKSVLVVDDEEDIAELIRDLLVERSYRVTISTDSTLAVDLIRSGEFHVVLSDFRMPGLDGQGLYEAVKEHDDDLVTRLGYVTGDAMGDKVTRFIASTHCPHIEKPIIAEELFALVSQLEQKTGSIHDE